MPSKQIPPAWYALRRTLPPWSVESNLRELVDVLPRYGVDEVIVKVDTEEFTHGQPPLDWLKRYQKHLFAIRDRLADIGVAYSVNPWITVGHNDRGRDSRAIVPGLATMVGHDGSRTTCCACPLSKAWRDHVAKAWTLYAETQPAVIWVEDDIRTFNHRPVEYSCFCPTHLKRFAKKVGQTVTRQELVDALLKPGKPHPWRTAWLDLQAEIMIDTVAFLAGVVHATAPQTSMGLMSSGPKNHCLEGRRWDDFAAALADGQPLYSRPPMGNYAESSLRGFYYSHDSIKHTRHALPAGVIEQTEVENVPFTRYANSVAFTFVEMAISFAFGCDGVTMNLYDHAGTPMEDEPWFGEMLGQQKPFLNALAAQADKNARYRGVQLLHHPRNSYVKRLKKGADYGDLTEDGDVMMQMLETHGLATTYQDEAVTAASGQVLRAFDDDRIRAMLGEGRGMLLDGVAAGVLVERGLGELIGLTSIAQPVNVDQLDVDVSAEEYFDTDFGGADGTFLTATLPSLGKRPDYCRMEPARGVQVISRLVDPDAKRHLPAMIAFENQLGGRVVIHGYDLKTAFGVSFCHPYRAEQLYYAINWLWQGQLPVTVRGGVYPLTMRQDCRDESLLGLFNLSLDAWAFAEFELADPRKINSVRRLSPAGRWTKPKSLTVRQSDGRWIVRDEAPFRYDEPKFYRLRWQ